MMIGSKNGMIECTIGGRGDKGISKFATIRNKRLYTIIKYKIISHFKVDCLVDKWFTNCLSLITMKTNIKILKNISDYQYFI